MPYFNAIGDDAQGAPAALKGSTTNWGELSAKVSIVVGMVTLLTMLNHTLRALPARRR